MVSPSVEQRIIRELSRRGTCSLLDLKSALRLSRGDIMGIAARLANRRSVRIEKDNQGEHINYTWTGPKEKASVGKSLPAKKPPPSPPDSSPPVQAPISYVASPRASRAKTSPEPLPADWKKRLEQSISGYSHHPEEQKIMLQLLQKKEVEEAASLIWKALKKMKPKWEASVFLERFQEVLFHLAVYVGLRRRTAKDFRTMAKGLEMIRDNEPFRKGPDREALERTIPILRHRAQNMSKTKPMDLGKRGALQFLRQYFQEYLQKPLNKATGLLIGATFGGKWPASTVGVRASERATYGLKKATAANTTKEAFAALDKLEGEELEAEFEKMSPRLQKLYLQSGME